VGADVEYRPAASALRDLERIGLAAARDDVVDTGGGAASLADGLLGFHMAERVFRGFVGRVSE
jgi:hypothetical protein